MNLDRELAAIKAENALYEAELAVEREEAATRVQTWFWENLEQNEAKLQRAETRERNVKHKAAVKIQNGELCIVYVCVCVR